MKKLLFFIILFISVSLYSVEYLSEKSEYIDVYFEKLPEGGYLFYGDNRHFIPQYINLGFTKLLNLKMDRENPSGVVLEPGAKKVLLAKLTIIQANKSYSFGSRLSYANGDPYNTKPDNYVYMFPFAHGEKFKLDQGFGGKFSHQEENFYALDFTMDVGTSIFAARSGIVIEVKEDSNRGGASSSYANDGNYIAIYHDDGTFASYVHLKKNGAIVKVGDKVKLGQIIGYSGNTGLSTGPHLHFSVNVPVVSGVRQSIPIKMKGLNGEAVEPVVGEFYYAVHPGGDDFIAVFGKNIKDSEYDGYLASVKESNRLNFRDETIDSTTIIFCRNGYNSIVEGEIKFSLRNSVTSVKSPVKINVPPLSEVFVSLVRPKDIGKPFSFSYSISYRVLE